MHLRVSWETVRSARKKRWLATACLGLVTGCTIFAPIQTPQADRRFALKNESKAGQNIPCAPINPEHPGECRPLEEDIDAFHGGLGRALWETDVRRRELLSQAADHTNLNSTYNALLWPLGAYVIERKIRQPDWRTLDVAAVAAASFGLLGSGIPDRDQLYVRTAARMACSITLFDADLYLTLPAQLRARAPQRCHLGLSRRGRMQRSRRLGRPAAQVKEGGRAAARGTRSSRPAQPPAQPVLAGVPSQRAKSLL